MEQSTPLVRAFGFSQALSTSDLGKDDALLVPTLAISPVPS